MARKSKRGRKSKNKSKDIGEPRKISPFWKQVYAFLLIVFAIFLLLGGLGTGGAFPTWLFKEASWLFGMAAYFLPFTIIYIAVVKFRSEGHVVPFSKLLSSILTPALLAGILHIFIDRAEASSAAAQGLYGGQIGNFVSSLLLGFLDSTTSFVLLIVLTLVSLLFAFSVTPKKFFGWLFRKIHHIFTKPVSEEATDLAQLKNRASHALAVNEAVPVMHHTKNEKLELDMKEPVSVQRMSSMKNSAKELTIHESHEALTIADDPNWKFPALELLNQKQDKADAGDVQGNADIIRQTLQHFNIDVDMEGANVGPRVTQFTLKPPTGVKLTKITALESNIALDLGAQSLRIEAPIPGKKAVGIEVPNVKAALVRTSSVLISKEWRDNKDPIGFAIGKDIAGQSVVGNLSKMPHLLIAGQTGSGKSAMMNTLLTSLLYKNSPSELKLILVDPKQVEFAPYNDIPHLLTPVITEPEKCISALKWAVAEMERRLRTFAEVSKRNIAEYNLITQDEKMPYIVIVIDELADLMMMAARDVEALIVRIAQKARAAGIHLVLATQRPSVDVITGLIKANVPARIAFTVASQIDSRTIIDGMGAEKLLGMGDMLFSTSEMPKPIRVQGAFISDDETVKVCNFLRDQRPPQYDDEVVSQPVQFNGKGGIVMDNGGGRGDSNADDDMFRDAVLCVIEGGKASTSYLQRRLRIGYSRAARLIEEMEERGIVGPADGSRARDVLVSSLDDVFGAPSTPTDEVYDDMPNEPPARKHFIQ
jgi:S-DNA-T family DNA segregation ATPase FtsK/SpoIIIE